MKITLFSTLFLVLIKARRHNASLLEHIQNVGQHVVDQMHGSLEELGNVASVLAEDLGDGVKTVS